MKAAVVYCSQTGSAATYARWLGEELGCTPAPIAELERVGADADLMVLAGWFHAASLKGSKPFKAYMARHPEKRYAVVAVGATPMPCELWPPESTKKPTAARFPPKRTPICHGCTVAAAFISSGSARSIR